MHRFLQFAIWSTLIFLGEKMSGKPAALLFAAVLLSGSNCAQALVQLTDVSKLATAASASHTCVVTVSSKVKCWGYSGNSQIRADNPTSTGYWSTAVDAAPSLTDAVAAVTTGGDHTCVLTTSGGLKCWGSNQSGQLGNGATSSAINPVVVTGLTSGVLAVAGGQRHTCALTDVGGVKCWGNNSSGQLGDGTMTMRLTPVDVSGLTSGITAIVVGNDHTCALTTAGGMKCWGINSAGNLGDGTITTRLAPVDVTGLTSGVSAMAAGNRHTCALTTAGGVKCTGDNNSGQVGNSSICCATFTMVNVTGLTTGVSAITAGGSHSCALMTTGGMKCWGDNDYGQLGDGTKIQRNSAVDVSGLGNVATISAGAAHTCAKTTIGGVMCWGQTTRGQVGNGADPNRRTPTDVTGLTSGVAVVAASSAINGAHTCALTTAGAVKCWGRNVNGQLGDGTSDQQTIPVNVVGLTSGVSAIAPGGDHSCALTTAGGVKCWGRNANGQLGNGGVDFQKLTPVDVIGLQSGVTSIAAGADWTCALLDTTGVKCWGRGDRVGDGTGIQRNTPVDVLGLTSGVTALVAGGGHTCVLTVAGAVKCWGLNINGQLGDGTLNSSLTAMDVSGLDSGIAAIAPGNQHTCAMTISGTVKCWGMNNGQLGDSTFTRRKTPVDVSGITSGITAIAAGALQTCAVSDAGALKCWGFNDHGQVGDGTLYRQASPVNVTGLSTGVGKITAGSTHSCVVTTGGGAKCWGDRADGRLGDGTIDGALLPTDVVIAVPAQLAVVRVNESLPVSVGVPFYLLVESVEGNLAGEVESDTTVTVALSTGIGPLNGTPNCTIFARRASCLVSGLTLNTVQSGAIVRAHRISGAILTDGESVPFAVQLSVNASLANLVLSAGTLVPGFSSDTFSYLSNVVSNDNQSTVTATVADSTASIKLNDVAVTSGSASPPISLSAGDNVIVLVVTAQDGLTTKSYTVNVKYSPTLDIDRSGSATKYDPRTDGMLLLRYLFGSTGGSLTDGALGGTAIRTDPAAIKSYLDAIRSALDIDGDGSADALSDGLLLVRYLSGLRGDALIAGAVGPLATRKTAETIEAYLQALLP